MHYNGLRLKEWEGYNLIFYTLIICVHVCLLSKTATRPSLFVIELTGEEMHEDAVT